MAKNANEILGNIKPKVKPSSTLRVGGRFNDKPTTIEKVVTNRYRATTPIASASFLNQAGIDMIYAPDLKNEYKLSLLIYKNEIKDRLDKLLTQFLIQDANIEKVKQMMMTQTKKCLNEAKERNKDNTFSNKPICKRKIKSIAVNMLILGKFAGFSLFDIGLLLDNQNLFKGALILCLKDWVYQSGIE